MKRLFESACVVIIFTLASLSFAQLGLAETAIVRAAGDYRVAVRQGGIDSAAVLTRLPGGTEVEVLIRAGRFSQIRHGNTIGWILTAFLELPDTLVIVVEQPSAVAFVRAAYPERRGIDLPFGTELVLVEVLGAATEVALPPGEEGSEGTFVIPSHAVRTCHVNQAVSILQQRLRYLGYDVGTVDNQMGPRTRGAIRSFLQDQAIVPEISSPHCQAAIVSSAYDDSRTGLARPSDVSALDEALDFALAPDRVRRQLTELAHALEERDCEALIGLPDEVLRGASFEACSQDRDRVFQTERAARRFERNDCDRLAEIAPEYRQDYPLEDCQQNRERRTQTRLAQRLFETRDCSALAHVDAAYLGENTVAACEQLSARETAQAQFEQALADLRCDAAADLVQMIGGEDRVQNCRVEAQRAANTAALEEAMQASDCDQVRVLAQRLNQSWQYETCLFNSAMNADTAQEMFLAGALFDANSEQLRAREIYLELMRRFPQDELSVRAAIRLTALNDAAQRQEEQARMEAEALRLQREVEEARAAAAAAAREAQAAARTPAPIQQTRRSPCLHLAVGQTVRTPLEAERNAMAAFLNAGLYGAYLRIVGLNHNTGVAHLISTTTGRTLDLRCSDLR